MLRRRGLDALSFGAPNITFSEPIDNSDANINNHGNQPQEFQDQDITVVGYLVIAGLLVVFAMVLLLLAARFLQQRRRSMIDLSNSEHGQAYHPTRRATKIRIQRRYETVEHWIISKRAVPHDDFCDAVVSNFCHHNETKKRQQQELEQNHEQFRNDRDNGRMEKRGKNIIDGPDHGDSAPVKHSTQPSSGAIRESVLVSAEDGGVEASESSSSSSLDDMALSPRPDSESMECPSTPIECKNKPTVLVNKSFVQRSSSASSSTPSCEVMTDDDDDESHSNTGGAAAIAAKNTASNTSSSLRECPICMGELLAGQIVSWSANEQCSHVYHHECIKGS